MVFNLLWYNELELTEVMIMVSLLTTVPCFKDIQQLIDAGINGIILSDTEHATIAAENVTLDEIITARALTKIQNVQLYVRCDRNFYDEELADLQAYLQALQKIDVDGIYYADMAVYTLAAKLNMIDSLIYDPETTITDQADIDIYLKQQNQRVVLAKELTLSEMLSIGQKFPDRIEMIIHGHLRMSRSRRQVLSGYQEAFKTTNLHLNRQITAQEESRDYQFPIVEDDFGTYTYSYYTLCSLNELMVITKDITYLRIDGIFKDTTYLLNVIKTYRAVLDGQSSQTLFDQLQAQYPKESLNTGFMYEKTNL